MMRIDNLARLAVPVLAFSIGFPDTQGQNVASAEGTAPKPPSVTVEKKPSLSETNVESQFSLGPADVIRVNVWKNSDLSQTITIDPEGFISLPLVGDIHAGGMTTNQLAKLLATRLSAYLVAAEVTVSVAEIRSRQVFVLGQVAKAGSYSLTGPLTVLQLIAQAGGLSAFADRKKIIVIRQNGTGTQRLSFNYTAAIQGDSQHNFILEPGDTVVVP